MQNTQVRYKLSSNSVANEIGALISLQKIITLTLTVMNHYTS